MTRHLLIVAAILICMPPTRASTYHVAPDGSGDYPTIQAAVTAVVAGDVIELGSGTFLGDGNRDVNLLGRAITIRSETGDPTDVIIDCEGSVGSPHRGFTFVTGEGAATILAGVTIRGGYVEGTWPANDCGGAINCLNGAAPTIRNCILEENGAEEDGGALACYGAAPRLEDVLIRNNDADDGGGVYFDAYSAPTFVRCTFTGNDAWAWGGALIGSGQSTLAMEDCELRSNGAYVGGGIFLSYTTPSFTATRFIENSATAYGGGLFFGYHQSPADIASDCLFQGNIAGSWGAGFYCKLATAHLDHCTFAENNAGSGGGACYAVDRGRPTLENCTLVANSAPLGSGGYASGPPTEPSMITLQNSIVAFGLLGAGAHCADQGVVALGCSDLFGNAGGDWVGCVEIYQGVADNFSADPAFCDFTNGDYTLDASSPCAPEHNPACGLVGAWPVGCGLAAIEPPCLERVGPALHCNPNPFLGETTLRFRAAGSQPLHLAIYDESGRRVRRWDARQAGLELHWNGTDEDGAPLPAGIYCGRLEADDLETVERLVLLR